MNKTWKMGMMGLILGTVFATGSVWGMDWNSYNESPLYAPTAMHQGFYQVDRVDTVSIDQYAPPIYVLSVQTLQVSPDGSTTVLGRTTYRLNYDTKEAWILQLDKPEWMPITTKTETSQRLLNKIFYKAYNMNFI